jgi:hypothetical protein
VQASITRRAPSRSISAPVWIERNSGRICAALNTRPNITGEGSMVAA